jgi:hypothetical protein
MRNLANLPGDYKARDNVTPLRPRLERGNQVSSFDQLTARMVMQRHDAGTLDPGIVAALLLAVGLQP